MNHFKRNKLFNAIYWQVRAFAPPSQYQFTRRVLITAERFSSCTMDPDNLIGSLKPVIDGLRHCGVIEDDTEKHVRIGEIKQIKSKAGAACLFVYVSPDE